MGLFTAAIAQVISANKKCREKLFMQEEMGLLPPDQDLWLTHLM